MTSARAPRRKPELFTDPDPLLIEPLLDRLEKLEANGAATPEIEFLKQSIAVQEEELRELRSKIDAQVEVRVAERIGTLERAMADQLTSIGGLSERAVDSDANLQRLIAVVERLCDRPLQSAPTVLPFESELAQAAERDMPVETRTRVIKQGEPDRRHRFPLGRTFAFLLAALLPGFHRS